MAKHSNARLLEQLLGIGRQMTETRALEPLLSYAVDVALELLNAQFGYLILIQHDGSLDFRVARDRNGNHIPDPGRQISQTILYRVIETRKYVRTASAVSDASFANAESVNELELKSVLCVPLISLGVAIGVIYLENRVEYDLFNEEDVEPLLYLAGHAAVCIQNAIISDELDELSRQRIDELTQTGIARKLITDELQVALEKERTRILHSFIQDASHQFKTPLAVIKTSVDLLNRKIDTDQHGNYLERIHTQVDTIVKLVDSLNLLANLDTDMERYFKRDNLALIVRDMREVLAQRAYQKGITVEEYSGKQVVEVELMQDLARQAIGKVLENAIQYTQPGGTISLDVIETDEAGHVVIADTGSGILPGELPLVMTRFYRGDKAGTTRGLGLGLPIARKIMQAHGGTIHIDSKPGKGTRVELVFPKSGGD